MKIYFAGSIRGGREDRNLYAEIIDMLKNYGEVLTEHIADKNISHMGQIEMTAEEIFPAEMVRERRPSVPSNDVEAIMDSRWDFGRSMSFTGRWMPPNGVKSYRAGGKVSSRRRCSCSYNSLVIPCGTVSFVNRLSTRMTISAVSPGTTNPFSGISNGRKPNWFSPADRPFTQTAA